MAKQLEARAKEMTKANKEAAKIYRAEQKKKAKEISELHDKRNKGVHAKLIELGLASKSWNPGYVIAAHGIDPWSIQIRFTKEDVVKFTDLQKLAESFGTDNITVYTDVDGYGGCYHCDPPEVRTIVSVSGPRIWPDPPEKTKK